MAHKPFIISPAAEQCNVRPIRADDRRFVDGPVDFVQRFRFVPSPPTPPSFGERLVLFFRRWQFTLAVASLALATLIGCYFAFRVGYGL